MGSHFKLSSRPEPSLSCRHLASRLETSALWHCWSCYVRCGTVDVNANRADLLQGIPVGLAFGSIPFLLRARLSYSQIGLFSLASYPYSLKLLWSPIVDACYSTRYGRRKSWIVPVQAIVGLLLWWLADHVPDLLERPTPDVRTLSFLFFTLVFFAATQGACGVSRSQLRPQTSRSMDGR